MTTSSLNTRHMGYGHPVSVRTHGETPEPTQERDTASVRHASEIQRMKDFAGRHRFQAPVADDFARGMLPPGQGPIDDTGSFVHVRGALASVMLGLRSLCPGQRAEDRHEPDAFKLD